MLDFAPPMRRIRLTTAGESHGPGLTAILQGLPGFGELQASTAPREELHTQRRLEAQDLARDGRLGEGEIAGRVGHGLVPGHDEEGPELGEGHVLLFRYVMAQMTNMRL